jgi:IS605 OrfB family transposase
MTRKRKKQSELSQPTKSKRKRPATKTITFPLPFHDTNRFDVQIKYRREDALKHLPKRSRFVNSVFDECAEIHKRMHDPMTLVQENVPWKQILDQLATEASVCQMATSLYDHLLRTALIRKVLPFWTDEKTLPISQKLSADTKDLFSAGADWFCGRIPSASWFNVNSGFSRSRPESYEDLGYQPKPKDLKLFSKAVRIRVYPSPEQKKTLLLWCHTSRYVYNKTLDHINRTLAIDYPEVVRHPKLPMSPTTLTNQLVTLKTRTTHPEYPFYTKLCRNFDFATPEVLSMLKECVSALPTVTQDLKPWEESTPKSIRQCAVEQMHVAYDTNLKLVDAGKKSYFEMKFQRRKEQRELMFQISQKTSWKIATDGTSISICPKSSCWTDGSALKVGKRSLKQARSVAHQEATNCILSCKDGRWHFITTLKVNPPPKKEFMCATSVAVDLGVRKFATCYSPHEFVVIQQNREKIKKLLQQIESIKKRKRSGSDPCKSKRRALMKRHLCISNLVTELHWKTARFLLTKYDHVFVGDIKSQGVLGGKLRPETKCEFQALSFYKFKLRLKFKAAEMGKTVVLTNEAYTSKTCTFCGFKNESLGSSEHFTCPSCTAEYDRDLGAARNIYLKSVQ